MTVTEYPVSMPINDPADLPIIAAGDPLLAFVPQAELKIAERRLVIDSPFESPSKRTLFLIVAILVAALHLAFAHAYWGPAHSGNNQSAYLVAGKLLATTGTNGFAPQNPFEFVGWMWNMADENTTAPGGGWYYPKYPLGLPLLNAAVFKTAMHFGGFDSAVWWTFKVSPTCMTLSLLAVFFITRLLAGSFAGVLSMISIATLTVIVILTNNPYSHAADVAFATWGVFALLKWWQRGGVWRGAIAGLLLGYAATIRYTEGLLVLPLLAAVLCSMRWHKLGGWIAAGILTAALFCLAVFLKLKLAHALAADPALPVAWWFSRWAVRSVLAATLLPIGFMSIVMIGAGHARMMFRLAVPLFAWACPLGLLVAWNLYTVGSPTGYDSTNESTGFTLTELDRKWRWGIDQLYNTGLYILLPLSLSALFMAFRWNWRAALVLMLWFVPGTVLYFSYYWGINLPVWGFLRFFTSVLPPAVILAIWLLQHAGAERVRPRGDAWRTMFGTRGAGRQVAVVVAAFLIFSAGGYAAIQWSLHSPHEILRFRFMPALAAAAAGVVAAAMCIDNDRLARRLQTAIIVAAAATLAAAAAWYFVKPDWAGERRGIFIAIASVAAALAAAGIRGAGRGVAPALAMGAIVAFPAAINIDVSAGPLERDYIIATNLASAAAHIRSAVPEYSTVFANSQRVCNYLQFAGNYQLFGSDYFLGGRPVPGINGGPDNDTPNPIQPGRKKFSDALYQKFPRDQRLVEARRVANEAIGANRRVFIIVEVASAGGLVTALDNAPDLKSRIVSEWTDSAIMGKEAKAATTGMDTMAFREPWNWKVVEILRETPPPATEPSITPTTQGSNASVARAVAGG